MGNGLELAWFGGFRTVPWVKRILAFKGKRSDGENSVREKLGAVIPAQATNAGRGVIRTESVQYGGKKRPGSEASFVPGAYLGSSDIQKDQCWSSTLALLRKRQKGSKDAEFFKCVLSEVPANFPRSCNIFTAGPKDRGKPQNTQQQMLVVPSTPFTQSCGTQALMWLLTSTPHALDDSPH